MLPRRDGALGVLLAGLAACGGSARSEAAAGADPPSADAGSSVADPAVSGGPGGWVATYSIDGVFVADARFQEDSFRAAGTRGRPAGCERSTSGTGVRLPGASAGDLDITVPTRLGEQRVALPFDPEEGEYETAIVEGGAARLRFDEPGSAIRVHAPGAQVPAFDVELRSAHDTVFEVPEAIDPSAPSDTLVSWSSGENDDVMIDLSLGRDAITCFFPASARSGTIPEAMLADVVASFREASAGKACTPTTCMWFLASIRSQLVAAGPYAIRVSHGVAAIREVGLPP